MGLVLGQQLVPSIGDWGVEVGQRVVVQGQAPCVKPVAAEGHVVPTQGQVGGHRAVGHRAHVGHGQGRAGGFVHLVPKQVLHDEPVSYTHLTLPTN